MRRGALHGSASGLGGGDWPDFQLDAAGADIGGSMQRASRILTALAVATLPHAARAATYTLFPGSNVQGAIDLAQSGDVLVLEPGTYTVSLTISGKSLTLRGRGKDGANATVVRPPFDSRAILVSGAPTDVVELAD